LYQLEPGKIKLYFNIYFKTILFSWRKWKLYIVAGICIVGFLVGLPLTCPGGG